MQTQERWLKKARVAHGDYYDYSLVEYNGAHAKVKIGCPKHGVFEQLATNHISGYGCPDRSHRIHKSTIPLTTETFVARAKEIHGDYYDYRLVEYTFAKGKVKVICPEHGMFEQEATKHLGGCGCPDYSHKQFDRLSFEEFLQRAIEIHGDRYDYSLLVLTNTSAKVKIGCSAHGFFEQRAADHIRGRGCDRCGGGFLKTTVEFIEKASTCHRGKFNYDLVEYSGSWTPVKIVCPIHGLFEQTPITHLDSYGCPECGLDSKRDTKEEFLAKAHDAHEGRYDYSLVEYQSSKVKVKIVCPIHGVFEQRPMAHIWGHGCIKCTATISKPETEWLDKIGVPQKYRQFTIKDNGRWFKVDGFNPDTNIVYEFYGDYWHGNPIVFDARDLNTERKTHFGELYRRTIEREGRLKKLGYTIVSIWEHDWKAQQRLAKRA